MRRWRWLVIVVAVAGCSDRTTINNYYSFTSGAISGRVVPADPGTKVMTADSTRVAYTDANGYFVLDSLQTGVYEIYVVPVHFSQRRLVDIAVTDNRVVSIGDIGLSNYPYPFYKSDPADGKNSINVGEPISVWVDEPLSLDDMQTLTTVTPALRGGWVPSDWGSPIGWPSVYSFYSSSLMRVATDYVLRIPGSVRTARGQQIGRELTIHFTTEPLRSQCRFFGSGINGGVPLLDFNPELSFNANVEADSVTRAVSFSPPINGVWITKSAGSGGSYFSFLAYGSTPLQAQAEYQMTVSNTVTLGEGLRLTRPDTVRFTTEPCGVIQSYPQNGARMHCTLCGVTLVFNTLMDSSSVTAAFSLRDMATDSLVRGEFNWTNGPRQMQFSPSVALTEGAVYRYRLDHSAHSRTGEAMTQDYAATFIIESLQ